MATYDPKNLEIALDRAVDPGLVKFVSDAELSWLWDADHGRIVWASPAALTFWAAESVAELAAREQSAAVHGNRQLMRIAKTLRDGAGCLERLRFFRHGREILLTCKVTAERAHGSRILRVQSVAAKQGKSDRGDVFDAIVASVPAAAILVRADGGIVAANAAAKCHILEADDGGTDLGRRIADVAATKERVAGHPLPADAVSGAQNFRLSVRKLDPGLVDAGPDEAALLLAALSPVDEIIVEDGDTRAAEAAKDDLAEDGGEVETVAADRDRDESGGETEHGSAPSDLRQDDENTEKSDAPSSGAAALVAAVNNAFGQRNTAQSQSDDTLNIVPFRGHDDPAAPPPGRRDQADQNDTEQDAFQAVADALSARLERGQTPTSELSGGNGTETGPGPATGKNQPFGKMPDQAEWQSLLTRLPLAIFVYRGSNARGVSEPVFANRALLGMYGYGSLESIRQAGGVAAILPKSDAPRAHGKRFGDIAIVGDHMPSIDSSLSEDEGVGENGNLFIHDSSGVRIPVNARLQAVKWHGQNAMMLSVLKADGGAPPGAQIHDLQRRDQSVKLESILDQVLDAYLILDVEGIVKSMNRGAKALFAVEDTEILGKPFSGLLRGPSDQQAELLFAAIRDRLPASSFGDGCEIVAKVSGGADMPYFLKIHPIEKAGNSLFCAVFSDISRWKTVEKEQTDARQRAERDNELKSTFLTKISHEIRTPLNAILGFSDAILEGKFGALEHAQYREYVQNINEGGKHLLSLINDLLDLSKVEAGKMALDFTSVNLNEVAAASIKLMQSDANKARIIIRSNLMPNLADVVADVRSLRQICLNLLSNAIKFTGPGGQVIVASRSTEHGEVELRVQDTGTGMNNRELEAAMEPFQQLDNQLDDTPGTGLGLPLTKALVEENRARFEIHSSKGHGTLVKITFPVNRVLAD